MFTTFTDSLASTVKPSTGLRGQSGRFLMHFARAMSILHALNTQLRSSKMHLIPDPCRFDGIRRDYTPAGRRAPGRQFPHPPHAGGDGRDAALAVAEDRAVRADAGRADRQPGGAAGQGRAAGDLPVRLAGRRRRQHRGPDVSRPVAVSGRFRAERGAPDQQRAAPRRPDRALGGRPTAPTGWRRSSPMPRPGSAAR